MIPVYVRRVGVLHPNEHGYSGTIATYDWPEGVDVTLVCEIAPPSERARFAPDYLGRWGKAPIIRAWRQEDERFGILQVLEVSLDGPELAKPLKFVAVERVDQPDVLDVWWWRGLEDFDSPRDAVANVILGEIA